MEKLPTRAEAIAHCESRNYIVIKVYRDYILLLDRSMNTCKMLTQPCDEEYEGS